MDTNLNNESLGSEEKNEVVYKSPTEVKYLINEAGEEFSQTSYYDRLPKEPNENERRSYGTNIGELSASSKYVLDPTTKLWNGSISYYDLDPYGKVDLNLLGTTYSNYWKYLVDSQPGNKDKTVFEFFIDSYKELDFGKYNNDKYADGRVKLYKDDIEKVIREFSELKNSTETDKLSENAKSYYNDLIRAKGIIEYKIKEEEREDAARNLIEERDKKFLKDVVLPIIENISSPSELQQLAEIYFTKDFWDVYYTTIPLGDDEPIYTESYETHHQFDLSHRFSNFFDKGGVLGGLAWKIAHDKIAEE